MESTPPEESRKPEPEPVPEEPLIAVSGPETAPVVVPVPTTAEAVAPPRAAKEPMPAGLGSTRTAGVWVAVAFGMALLVVVIVLIIQNNRSVKVKLFGASWTIPLAADLLLAAVLGGLIVFMLGTARILQLRRAARRRHAPEAKEPPAKA